MSADGVFADLMSLRDVVQRGAASKLSGNLCLCLGQSE